MHCGKETFDCVNVCRAKVAHAEFEDMTGFFNDSADFV